MYRQGLGDCFLLSFRRPDSSYVHVMIDCGVILGTSNPSVPMKAVANDIRTTTSGHVDVLVITHEHWDHLSGFDKSQAMDVFDHVEFGALWLAWTEQDGNATADRLRSERELKKAAANAARKETLKRGLKKQNQRLAGLLGFFGAAAAGATAEDTEEDSGHGTAGALAYLRKKRKPYIVQTGKKVESIPGLDNVRVYALGPPTTEDELKSTNPNKSERFELGGDNLGLAQAFLGACDPKDEHSQPFTKTFRKQLPKNAPYNALRNRWRNIDNDWLAVGERLALQLDSATNNTSLVLAFEFIDSEEVLLFVGDAQAGNWRCWDKWTWKVTDKHGDRQPVTARDLLSRTVFYKVGHHGSHNATMRNSLDQMNNSRLAAVIPVDIKVAHDVKLWKHMPLPAIQNALQKQCSVVFQSDATAIGKEDADEVRYLISKDTFPVEMKVGKSKKAKIVRNENLYYDYFV